MEETMPTSFEETAPTSYEETMPTSSEKHDHPGADYKFHGLAAYCMVPVARDWKNTRKQCGDGVASDTRVKSRALSSHDRAMVGKSPVELLQRGEARHRAVAAGADVAGARVHLGKVVANENLFDVVCHVGEPTIQKKRMTLIKCSW